MGSNVEELELIGVDLIDCGTSSADRGLFMLDAFHYSSTELDGIAVKAILREVCMGRRLRASVHPVPFRFATLGVFSGC